MLSSTLTKPQEPISVWLIDNPDKLEIELKVLIGDSSITWSILQQLCAMIYLDGRLQDNSFLVAKSYLRNIPKLVIDWLKENGIEVIIPPMEMTA